MSAAMDTAQLRKKYEAERDKRLRNDGNDQYLEPTGRFSHYLVDPYTEVVEREPLFDEVTVAFIGGGFSGLVTGAKLVEAGITDVRIIEKGGDFGGIWYWNRYPGAQCDTASFVYMPMLEATGHMPTEKYAHAPEILEHCQNLGEHFGLYNKACMSTEVTDLTWDEEACRWIIGTNRGDKMRAKFVAMGTGPLHRPKLPGIKGIEAFKGHSFHTSRWDYEYTGGNPAGAPMTNLANKRVGIIGTGATAVQCVPHLARACKELLVFQRTPSSIEVRNNHKVDPEWFETLEPGWQKKWMENFTILQTGGFADEDLVMDGWTDITLRIRAKLLSSPNPDLSPAGLQQAYFDSDDEKMTELRARIDEVIADPNTADSLKPWYRQLCKRPCFHDQFLQAFNTPGTQLIDTDGQGVEEITETGVVVDGVDYELDCLIYASGFEVGTDYARRSGYDMVGRDGEKLSEHWKDGMVTMHGLHVHGFPNAFIVGPAQGAALISNVPHNLVEAGETIATIVSHALENELAEVEVTAEAEAAWVGLLESGPRRFGNDPSCTPGYYNNEGKLADRAGVRGGLGYPEGAVAYFEFIDRWRKSGEFEGLKFRSRTEES
jgi:cation diffusion facilitator CzcD-associated flavoprotein CzcO